jgi:putative MATE family efflux protein
MDTVMLGSLGETAISATTLANQLFFIFTIACVGISGSGQILASQYWGKGDLGAIRTVTSITLKIVTGVAALFTAAALLFPAGVIGIYTKDAQVIAAGVDYLRLVACSYLLFGISSILLTVLRSVENVRVAAVIYAVTFSSNILFNYLFIFGKLGLPRLGIVGAAAGTLLARLIELILVLLYMQFFEKKIRFRLPMLRLFDAILLKDMIRYGLPVLLNEVLWAIGISIHAIILGHISAEVVAANSIAFVVYQFTTSIILGIANASAVMIGKVIGQKDIELTCQYARRLRRVYLWVGLSCTAFMLLVRLPVLSLYNIQASTRLLAGHLIIVYSVIIFFMSYACCLLMGIFRGSGDTRFALITDISCLWSAIPLGAAAAFVFVWSPVVVCALLRLDMPLKAIICLFRLRGTRWIHQVTRDAPVA